MLDLVHLGSFGKRNASLCKKPVSIIVFVKPVSTLSICIVHQEVLPLQLVWIRENIYSMTSMIFWRRLLVQSIYEKYLANPPQIATVLCSEQPPESQKKSLRKSKWWNIVKIIYN